MMRAPLGLICASLAGSTFLATAAEAKGPIRCLPPADLASVADSLGTGPDNEKRAYAFFLERYGRPAAFRRQAGLPEITYGSGRATLRITLERDTGSGRITIACRDGG